MPSGVLVEAKGIKRKSQTDATRRHRRVSHAKSERRKNQHAYAGNNNIYESDGITDRVSECPPDRKGPLRSMNMHQMFCSRLINLIPPDMCRVHCSSNVGDHDMGGPDGVPPMGLSEIEEVDRGRGRAGWGGARRGWCNKLGTNRTTAFNNKIIIS